MICPFWWAVGWVVERRVVRKGWARDVVGEIGDGEVGVGVVGGRMWERLGVWRWRGWGLGGERVEVDVEGRGEGGLEGTRVVVLEEWVYVLAMGRLDAVVVLEREEGREGVGVVVSAPLRVGVKQDLSREANFL